MTQKNASPEAVIDAHHHLWHYTQAEFDWIDDSMAALRRDFAASDLSAAMQDAGVNGTVAVQARQSLEETGMLLQIAVDTPEILGVVGWLPLADRKALEAALGRYGGHRKLAGARHVVQGEPDGFLDEPAFNQGIEILHEAGLAYDLLLRAGQLEESIRFVDRHPRQRFVVDHLAKPGIAARELEPWSTHMRELAQRPHVFCKLSGMVTEDNWECWSPASLRPYLDLVIDAFGPGRIMVGSDWPVCLVATSYPRWWNTIRAFLYSFSSTEQAAMLGGNAQQFYRLGDKPGRTVNLKSEGATNHATL